MVRRGARERAATARVEPLTTVFVGIRGGAAGAGPGMTVPTITLNDGSTIPQLGFGVFQIDPAETAEAVTRAFEIGYRHIDTAQMYGNERGVGEAIAASGIPRDEIYVTSKLNNGFHRPEDATREFAQTLEKLGLEQIDLFLIHWPLPTRYDGDFVSTWRTMASFVEDGRARSVGVSNFQPAHLQRIIDETGVVPAVNQIEVHPYLGNEEARAANAAHGIATEAWSPIAQGKVLDDAVLREIAAAKDVTTAQVALRWHIERGDIVFPKSVTPSRMQENFDIFGFELSPDEVSRISALDRGEAGRTGPNPDVFDYIPD
ncbi:2,5-diketo-D-gluconate reductase A [Phycicoccus duodecadis]|uniref:2,5-diketo-D-gluconate reductase A n=2 Tax=Phycicoccus duodecadis TaxID=173053 RepID=A0A2N3YLW8_9MICO|nr:2,5-diketo-D-gluconate reductase A [Phycicoccus duodecadis]